MAQRPALGHAQLVEDARSGRPSSAEAQIDEWVIEIAGHAVTVVTVAQEQDGASGSRRATALLQRDNVLLEAQAFGSSLATPEDLAVQLVARMSEHVDGVLAGEVTWKPIASRPPRGYTPPVGSQPPIAFTSMMLSPRDIVGPAIEVDTESCVPTEAGAVHARSFTARTPRFLLDGYEVEWLRIFTELYESPEAARLAIAPLLRPETHDPFYSRIVGPDGRPLVTDYDQLGSSFHARDIADGGASYKVQFDESETYSFFVARVDSVIVTVAAFGSEPVDHPSDVVFPIGELAVARAAEVAELGVLTVPPSCTDEETRPRSGPTI